MTPAMLTLAEVLLRGELISSRVGDEIIVELSYTELLKPTAGIYSFVYPTVVGPRYYNQKAAAASEDDQFVSSPYTKSGQAPSYKYDMELFVSAGMPIQQINCSSHQVKIQHENLRDVLVSLDPSEHRGGNRDFILNYRLSGGKVASGLLMYQHEDENFFLLMVQPPKRVVPEAIPPREYVFIVDVSGSMSGFPLDISKKLLRNLIIGLQPSDRFNVLLFAGTSGWLADESLAASSENVEKAIQLIDKQQGGGGTELLPALEKALDLPRCAENLSRSFIVISDGYIHVEDETFELIRNKLNEANLFSFGIGSSVNRHLMEGMARMGQAEAMIITKEEEAEHKAEQFRQYINAPVLTQVKADFGSFEVYEVEPAAIPDVMAERPVILFGKWKGPARGLIKLSGFSGNSPYQQSFNVAELSSSSRNTALRYLWARERIKTLDDYNKLRSTEARIKEVTQLGLKYNLMTAYTSFIAVDNVPIENQGELKTVKQALPLPAGVPNTAVGFDLAINKVVRKPSKKLVHPPAKRPSITFIMGEDKNEKNPYYQEARNYYQLHPHDRTEMLVDSLRSLVEIRDHLQRLAVQKGRPWGRVNIVLHSNEWMGLSIPVFPNGERATTNSIQLAVEEGKFEELNTRVIDEHTQFNLNACGLGKNRKILEAIKRAFFGQNPKAKVNSSPYFVSYTSKKYNAMPYNCKRYYSEYYYAFFKTGYRPGDIRLSRQLKQRYPETALNWRDALSRTQPRWPGDTYHYSFKVPIVWIVTYASQAERPEINTKAGREKWLDDQEELQESMRKMDIPKDKFNWTFRKINYEFADGTVEPAIKAIGFCTILTILKPLELKQSY